MKIKHTRTLKDGRVHVLIELGPTEAFPVQPVDENAFYQLGYPHDCEVLPGHIIKDAVRVYWDSIEQKWMEA